MNFILGNCACKGGEKKNKGEGKSNLFSVMTVAVAAIDFGLSYSGFISLPFTVCSLV